MGKFELIALAVGLSMDAFSVAVCKGLSMKKLNYKGGIITALFFGIFQALMPLIGYFLGSRFESYIKAYSHWIGFVLLVFIGGKMIFEVIFEKEEEKNSGEYKLDIPELFLLAIATSIDALAVGVVVATERVNLACSVTVIGIMTFALSLAGVIIGNKFGNKYEKKAQIAGGAILILIGVKLLLDGLGVLK